MDAECLLYEKSNESMDYFFLCQVSEEVWQSCQRRCAIFKGEYSRLEELERLKIHYVKSDFQGQIRRVSLVAAVYHLWKARNAVCHQNKPCRSQGVIEAIEADVRNAADSWRSVDRNLENWNLAAAWRISPNR